jgi:hypothetical protein
MKKSPHNKEGDVIHKDDISFFIMILKKESLKAQVPGIGDADFRG